MEAKAGDAVRAFDHNIVREEISNSLKKLQKEIYHNSIGIWYWLISGKDLPRSSSEEHGGPRGDNLSHTLPQKLFEIVRTAPKSPVYATCFTTSTWACYISYLYGLIATYNINVITPTSVPHFWNWSPNHLFTNDVGAPVSVYNNSLPFCNNFE